jgi:hypothetical protein
MNNVFTDIEFIKAYDSTIGELYENSKNFYLDAPIQALMELRSILELMCKQFIEEHSLAPANHDIYSNISELEKTKKIAPYITTKLHTLRINTNKAAHKHENDMSYEQFSTLALGSLTTFCGLIEDLQLSINNKKPSYRFIPEVKSRFKELSYKAIFEEDKNAKFLVGLALFHKYMDQLHSDDESSVFIDNSPLNRGVSLIKESAIDRHPEAMFEYGCILIHGKLIKKDYLSGVSYLYSSASSGYTKAKSHYAHFAIEDTESTEEDIKYAMDFLYESVDEEDAFGQMLLSKLLSQGKYVDKDIDKALALLNLSAEGGCKDAMFELGKHLFNNDTDQDAGFKYIVEAETYGHIPAKLYICRVLVEHNSNTEKVRSWYESYLRFSPNDFQVYIEFAEYLYSQSDLNVDVIKHALSLLIIVCQIEACPLSIIKKANQLSPVWLDAFSEQIILHGQYENMINIYTNFSPKGTVIIDLAQINQNVDKIAKNPRLMENLIFIPKQRRGLFTQKKVIASTTKKVGRNDPCSCNSGKKYKICCG